MKRLIVSIILIATALLTFSQAKLKVPMGTKSEVEKFYNTTTYVVLKSEFLSDYNPAIKEAVTAHWKITPYKFIKASEFEKLRKDTDKSFLMINIVYFEGDKSNTKFDFLTLSLGGNYRTVDDMPTLCAIPLCYNSDDAEEEDEDEEEEKYICKLGAMVKHCQTHVKICHEHPELTKETIMDYYLNNSPSLENKKLYIQKDEVAADIRSQSQFKAAYPFDFEFASSEQIANLVKGNDSKALITHIISPLSNSKLTFCVKIVIDTKDGMIYYYDAQKIKKNTDGYLTASDLKGISKK